jgi:hypothetical protein
MATPRQLTDLSTLRAEINAILKDNPGLTCKELHKLISGNHSLKTVQGLVRKMKDNWQEIEQVPTLARAPKNREVQWQLRQNKAISHRDVLRAQ